MAASNAAAVAAVAAAATASKTLNGGQNGAQASVASTASLTENKNGGGVSANKKRKTKKPFEELRRPMNNGCEQPQNGEHQHATPDSSGGIKQEHDHEDLADHVDGNGVGGIAENWSDQQTIKVKVSLIENWRQVHKKINNFGQIKLIFKAKDKKID